MDTIVKTIGNFNSSEEGSEIFCQAGELIKEGGLVAFPTETVYGLGGDALNPESSRKIYAAKGRPSDNPLIVHIADWTSIKRICMDIPDEAKQLADTFWPGPLTMILKKSTAVPYETTGGLDTVAVRLPDHPVAISLIKASGGFIAAPSANLSGRPSPTTAAHVIEDMDGRIDMILDGGDVGIGLESTIVDLTEKIPVILRPGYVTQEMLNRVLGRVDVDITLMDQDTGQAPKAPGMKYRHYAPKGSMRLIEGDREAVIRTMNAEVTEAKRRGECTGVMITDEIWEQVSADVKKSVGNRENEYEIARRLYRILREFDEEGVTAIFSESFSPDGFGQAVMNRLLKAAGYTVEKV
ncbi:MAG: threonylcarbamoyl-AMP synthase [Lachnospiraceae bacterium]|nr:threonylcarbamoyl-AMP synthase [Lachnospiraceae bacterium]